MFNNPQKLFVEDRNFGPNNSQEPMTNQKKQSFITQATFAGDTMRKQRELFL
jgi:hypothetical protein